MSSYRSTIAQSKDIYRQQLANGLDVPLFYQDWYLDALVGPNAWDVALVQQQDRIIGIWPYLPQRWRGIKAYFQPTYVAYWGPLALLDPNAKTTKRLSQEDKILDQLAEQLPSTTLHRFKLRPRQESWLALYRRSYRSNVRYTYLLDQIKNQPAIWQNLKSTLRNDIRHAQDKYELVVGDTASTLYQLNQATLDRKGQAEYKTETQLSSWIAALRNHEAGEILSIYKDGTAAASCLVAYDQHCAYLLLLGVDKAQKARGAAQWVIWEAIRYAAERVDTFDFEGSMIPEVEPVFRGFGGQRTPVIEVCKAPRWAEIAFILANKERW